MSSFIQASEAFEQMNRWGSARVPHFFMFDFELDKALCFPLDEMEGQSLRFRFRPSVKQGIFDREILSPKPIDYKFFSTAFDKVMGHLKYGDTFLVNLSFSTPLELNIKLAEIFEFSRARYNIFLPNHFVCFSPEAFVRIKRNRIYSYPIKGTMDAEISRARELILENEKEKAEHYTIVDLIRNDLSQVASKVSVPNFREVHSIRSAQGSLLQVSSTVEGVLPEDWADNLGTVFSKLLPAGSISGAPKPKTLEVIQAAETGKRGFYTGVCGVFDGKTVDSCVMIRFIEQRDSQAFYRSGGGITHLSRRKDEYEEVLKKIYVPIY